MRFLCRCGGCSSTDMRAFVGRSHPNRCLNYHILFYMKIPWNTGKKAPTRKCFTGYLSLQVNIQELKILLEFGFLLMWAVAKQSFRAEGFNAFVARLWFPLENSPFSLIRIYFSKLNFFPWSPSARKMEKNCSLDRGRCKLCHSLR